MSQPTNKQSSIPKDIKRIEIWVIKSRSTIDIDGKSFNIAWESFDDPIEIVSSTQSTGSNVEDPLIAKASVPDSNKIGLQHALSKSKKKRNDKSSKRKGQSEKSTKKKRKVGTADEEDGKSAEVLVSLLDILTTKHPVYREETKASSEELFILG